MCLKYLLYMGSILLTTLVSNARLHATYDDANPLLYIHLESQYPSYIAKNGNGLCLRARTNLDTNTVVGTATMITSKVPYIHNHPNITYRHVSIIGFRDKKPLYGRVIGKYAFCNHSCEPNCKVTPDFLIKTIRPLIANEEITLAYDAYIPHVPWQPDWSFNCFCNKTHCKKYLDRYRNDIIHPASYNTK